MHRHLRLVSLVLAALCTGTVAFALVARSAHGRASASGANLGFAPTASTITIGATPVPTVDVTVAQASNIGGYDAWVQFNGSVVHLDALTDAGFLANPNPQGTPQNFVTCTTPTVTATYGHLACSVLPLPPPFPPPMLPSAGLTPAAVVHAAFSGTGAGTSPLSLTAVAGGTPETTLLLDINATPIAATLGGGSITVNGGTPASVGGVADVATLPPAATRTRGSSVDPLLAGMVLFLATGIGVAWWLRRRAERPSVR